MTTPTLERDIQVDIDALQGVYDYINEFGFIRANWGRRGGECCLGGAAGVMLCGEPIGGGMGDKVMEARRWINDILAPELNEWLGQQHAAGAQMRLTAGDPDIYMYFNDACDHKHQVLELIGNAIERLMKKARWGE